MYDDYKQWPLAYEHPRFNVKRFQKKIDAIIGVTVDNKPIARLQWAWDSREYIAGDWRAKYRFMTVEVPGGVIDICPPRWVLEERNEPGQYEAAWEAGRYFTDPETKERVDLRGPAPREGWYSYLELVAEHDDGKACCDYLWETERRRCWGYYREPAQKDLDQLVMAKALRDKNPYNSPHAPLSEATLAEIGREAFTRQEEAKAKRTSELELAFHDSIAPHAHRFEAVYVDGQLIIRKAPDTGLRSEKYHFIGG